MASQSRNEYLQSLNRMRSNWQNQGNPLVNTVDDSTSVGNELSSFAYMQTPSDKSKVTFQSESQLSDVKNKQELQDYKDSRNGWQRFWDTINEWQSDINEGIANFMDSIWDTTVGVTAGVFGGGYFGAKNGFTDWAEDAIKYDWESQYTNFNNKMSTGNLWNGDMFTADYWNDWGNLGSSDASRNDIDKLHASSFVSDTSSDFQSGYNSVVQGIGEALPSIVVAVVTGGSSAGLSLAAQAGIQGGIGLAQGYGHGMETALNEGADYGKASAYAASKGAIQGTLDAATFYAGGSIANKAGSSLTGQVGEKFASFAGKVGLGATGQHIAGIAGETLTKAGVASIRAAGDTALDPVLKSVYDDGKAIEYAYGQGHIGEMEMQSITTAATMAAVMNVGKEAIGYASIRAGSSSKSEAVDTWNKNYYDALSASAKKQVQNAQDEYNKINKEYAEKLGYDTDKLSDDMKVNDVISGMYADENGNITLKTLHSSEEYKAILKDYSDALTKWSSKYSKLVDAKIKALPNNEYTSTAKADLATSKTTALNMTPTKSIIKDFAKQYSYLTKDDISSDEGVKFSDGSVYKPTSETTGTLTTSEGRTFRLTYANNKVAYTPRVISTNAINTLVSDTQLPTNNMVIKANGGKSLLVISKQTVQNAIDDGLSIDSLTQSVKSLSNRVFEMNSDGKISGTVIGINLNTSPSEDGATSENGMAIVKVGEGGEITEVTSANASDVFRLLPPGANVIDAKTGKEDPNYPAKIAKGYADSVINGKVITKVDVEKLYKAVIKDNSLTTMKGSGLEDLVGKTMTAGNVDGKEKTKEIIIKGLLDQDIHDRRGMIDYESEDSTTLRELMTPEQVSSVEKEASLLVEAMFQNSDDSKITKVIDEFNKKISSLTDVKNEYKRRIDITRKLQKTKSTLQRKYGKSNLAASTIDEKLLKQGATMQAPFKEADFAKLGLSKKTFMTNLKSVADSYNQETWEGTSFGYVPQIADAMNEVLNMPNDGTATADEMTRIYELQKMISARIKEANKEATDRLEMASQARADQETFGLDKGEGNFVKEAVSDFVDYINNPMSTLDNKIFGRGTLMAKLAMTIRQDKFGRDHYVKGETFKVMSLFAEEIGDITDKKGNISQAKVEKAGAKINKLLDTELDIGGTKMPFSVALEWYINLKNDDVDADGLHSNNYTDAMVGIEWEADNKLKNFKSYDDGVVDALKNSMDAVKPGFADNAMRILMDGYERMGKELYEPRSRELCPTDVNVVANHYYPDTPRRTSSGIGSPEVAGVFSFNNRITRVEGRKSIGLKAKNPFQYYFDYLGKVATWSMVMPDINRFNQIFDTKLSIGGDDTLAMHITPKYKAVADQWGKQVSGALKPMRAGYISSAVTTFSISNPKTWVVQNLSWFTSGTKFSTFFKHGASVAKNAVSPSKEAQAALSKLNDKLPQYEHRGEKNEFYYANTMADGKSVFNKVGQVFTSPANMVDRFTLREIALSSLYEAQDDLYAAGIKSEDGTKLPLSDDKVIDSALERAQENYLTQISSDPADLSPSRFGRIPWSPNPTVVKNFLSSITRAYAGAAQGFVSWSTNQIADIRQWSKIDPTEYYKKADEAKARAEEAAKQSEDADARIAEAQINIESLRDDRNEAKAAYDALRKHDPEAKNDDTKAAKDAYEEAKAKVQEEKNNLSSAEDDKEKADFAESKAKGEQKSYKNTGDNGTKYKKSGGAKTRLVNLIGGALLMGLGSTALQMLDSRIKGYEKWNEADWGEEAWNLAANSTINMIPGLRTISSFISGYDISDPTMEAISQAEEVRDAITNLIKNQSEGNVKAVVRQAITLLGMITQIPVSSIWKYYYGITSQFSPELALKSKNLFYQVSLDTSSITSAVASGDNSTAVYYIGAIGETRTGAKMSEDAQNEFLSYYQNDVGFMPKQSMTSYTDETGATVNLTTEQVTAFKTYYSQAETQAEALMKLTDYKSLTKAEQASAAKKIYDTYYDYAKSKVLKTSSTGKIATAVSITNGVFKPTKFIVGLSKISSLKATETQTKKELAIETVNKMKGLSKDEKLLLLYMAGYTLSDESNTKIKNLLRKYGASSKDVKAFVGG